MQEFEPSEPLKDFIAKRLVQAIGDRVQQEPARDYEKKQELEKTEAVLPPADFVKVEKNLASLGFFTPSSKRIKDAKSKTITFTKVIDEKRIDVSATIVPGAIYGLPITSDQDKFFALMKIINDRMQTEEVQNPVSFTSAELLRLLGRYRDSGKNYREVGEWLDVMTSTMIVSEGAVYFAGQKRWVKDRFHVVDRAVGFGKEIEPGKVADKNYVWLSEWQWENIRNNHLLPVDFENYKQLKNHIAKALVPLLQIWLFASRATGFFEKRYDELCQILKIRPYHHLSRLKEQLGSSLDELKRHGYIADCKIEKTSDGKNYKVVFYHGKKFHRDRERRLAQKAVTVPVREDRQAVQTGDGTDHALLAELTKRGIPKDRGITLLRTLAQEQHVIDQLEWGDYLIQQSEPGKFRNPTGFYIHLIKTNVIIPDTFETSRKQKLRLAVERGVERERQERFRLEIAYDEYITLEIDKHISALPEGKFQELIDAKKRELAQQYKGLASRNPDALTKVAWHTVRSDLAKWITFQTFEVFCEEERKRQTQLGLPYQQGTTPPESSQA